MSAPPGFLAPEPFLRPEFAEICAQFIRHNGVKQIYVPTNAYFTDRVVKQVSRTLGEESLQLFVVEISLRPGIADPQGATVERAWPALGFDGVHGVRVGKSVRFTVVAWTQSSSWSRAGTGTGTSSTRTTSAGP